MRPKTPLHHVVIIGVVQGGFRHFEEEGGLAMHLLEVAYQLVLSHWALSLGWVFVCFPVGVALGLLFYTFLDAMSP
jgi:hypothetical protein